MKLEGSKSLHKIPLKRGGVRFKGSYIVYIHVYFKGSYIVKVHII